MFADGGLPGFGRVRGALACMLLGFGLAACGGGGGSTSTGGGTSGSTGTGTGTGGSGGGAESAYLLAEFVAGDVNHQSVHVWDPARPSVAVEDVPLVQTNGIAWTSSHLMFSDATQYDASTRTVQTLGHAKVFYDNGGALWSIDLRGGQSHAPVQLSSASDVFTTVGVFPLTADGADAWVDAQGGTHDWAMRATMSATDVPVSILHIAAALRDASTGLPQYLFVSIGGESGTAVQPTTFEVVGTSFGVVPVNAVGTMGDDDGWVGADPAQAGLGYLKIAGQMRALRWSAAGVGVDAADLHDFAQSLFVSPGVADAQALYFEDGASLLAVADASVSTVGAFSIAPDELVDAGGYIVGVEDVPQAPVCCTQVETLSKSTGGTTMVVPAQSGVQLIGADGASLVVSGIVTAARSSQQISLDGTMQTTIAGQSVGLVRAASSRLDQPAMPVALMSCVADATLGFCTSGALSMQDLASGAVTDIGTLSVGTVWLQGDMTQGIVGSLPGQTFLPSPFGFGQDETDARDAWQFTPGSAAPLVQVTANL